MGNVAFRQLLICHFRAHFVPPKYNKYNFLKYFLKLKIKYKNGSGNLRAHISLLKGGEIQQGQKFNLLYKITTEIQKLAS